MGWGFAPASYDDGYITYRYADNLAHGRGLVFNPGELVLGTSAPGYAAFLAGLTYLLQPFGVGVDCIGATLFLGCVALLPLLLCGILKRIGVEHPEVAAGTFAVLSIPAQWNVEMMGCEQIPILTLVAASFLFAIDRRDVPAGICAGFAAALRFDAGLAVASVAVAMVCDRRRLPWRFSVAALVPVLACWAWLLKDFGTIVPTTLAGKRSEFHLISNSYSHEEIQWLFRSSGRVGTSALILLALWGFTRLAQTSSSARLQLGAATGWLALHEVFYRAADVPFAPWYQIALLNALFALSGVAIAAASSKLEWNSGRRVLLLALATCLVAAISLPTLEFVRSTWGRPPDPRIRVYRDVALALKLRADPGAVLASVEIGALAYFGDRPILDLAGLLDERVRQARQDHRFVQYLKEHPPEFLLDNPTFHASFLAGAVTSGLLRTSYEPFLEFSRPEYPHTLELLAYCLHCEAPPR